MAPPPLKFWAVIGPAQEQLYSVYVYCVTGQALDKCSWFSWVNLSGQQHGVGVWTLLVFNKKPNNGDSNKPVVAKNCLWRNKIYFFPFFYVGHDKTEWRRGTLEYVLYTFLYLELLFYFVAVCFVMLDVLVPIFFLCRCRWFRFQCG